MFEVVLAGALLHPDLAHAVVPALRRDDLPGFLDREAQGLLNIDVFSSLEGINANQRVPVDGRRDQHRIHNFRVEHLAMIGVALTLRSRRL